MIDFYYWPTPNGWKVAIMLEECGLEYRTVPVNIGKGDQFKPEFLAISPNNRMPAIVDHDEPGGPLSVFESGAILLHLADKSGSFAPTLERSIAMAYVQPSQALIGMGLTIDIRGTAVSGRVVPMPFYKRK